MEENVKKRIQMCMRCEEVFYLSKNEEITDCDYINNQLVLFIYDNETDECRIVNPDVYKQEVLDYILGLTDNCQYTGMWRLHIIDKNV